jgi:hypothetical protein
MAPVDGLNDWSDGPVSEDALEPTAGPPILGEDEVSQRLLWAVREKDVPYAAENCEFGKGLPSGVIKHSNLTGGRSAYSAGEMLFSDDSTVVVNGRSGRYGPQSAAEMSAVALAFRRSGYFVWQMGYDTEANFPLPFIGIRPQWVRDV